MDDKTARQKVNRILNLLDLKDYAQAREYLLTWRDELAPQEEEEKNTRANQADVLGVVRTPKVTYQLEKIRCGKNCKKCPHGPYWYGYYSKNGRTVSKYIGKTLTAETNQKAGIPAQLEITNEEWFRQVEEYKQSMIEYNEKQKQNR